ncbi:U3 small nuclear riboprotein factor 55K isoform X2 [Brevipalpus obovatus]|uniref:U3 small nuclear riboprotein factor 55K isoform X2 n=1 Tax=Brevipalpus obovatus TaxID=246614 RepID=UPI003D9EFB57
MSFFLRKNKRRIDKKRKKQLVLDEKVKGNKRRKELDEEIESESDEDANAEQASIASSEDEIEETAKDKRLRLAKKYLQEIEDQERERLQDDDGVEEAVSSRMRMAVLEKSNKLIKKAARTFTNVRLEDIRFIKNVHRLPITSLAISSDNKYIFSVSKDGSITKCCFETGKKLSVQPGIKKNSGTSHGHVKAIQSIVISSDSRLLATGCEGSIICLWNPNDLSFIHSFRGHKAAVNGVIFRRSSHTLYSCSSDRTVKVWNCDDLCYVETLFGHQDKVTSIDCGIRERPVSCGGGDQSVRVWKVVEQSQLVLQGHTGSIDCVRYITEDHFITGGDDGIIAIWSTLRKKPLFSHPSAHGHDRSVPNWITCIATLFNTDVFASGSKDGLIKIWKCSSNFDRFSLLFTIPVIGFVNHLQFSLDGLHLIAAVAREHRFGRWWSIREAKNCIMDIPLERTDKT